MTDHAPVPTEASPTILVVEDDLPVAQMARHILEGAGYGVELARSAEEAAEALLSSDRIDLVFTDVVLPGRSGLDLAASLAGNRLALLITTGQRTAEVQRGIVASGHPYLPKPYTADGLLEAVDVAIGVRGR